MKTITEINKYDFLSISEVFKPYLEHCRETKEVFSLDVILEKYKDIYNSKRINLWWFLLNEFQKDPNKINGFKRAILYDNNKVKFEYKGERIYDYY